MNRLRLALACSLLVLSLGCKGKCRQLSEKLCECSPNTLQKDACVQRAQGEEGRLAPTEEDEAICAQLLETCDCRLVDTPEGKRACGLAR